MYPEQKPFVDFRKRRDFGMIFNDSFAFVKQNFKSLLACMLLLPTPLFLIAGGFYGHMQSMGMNANSFLQSARYGSDPFELISQMMQSMIPYYLFIWLGSLVSMATIFRFMILHQERKENNSIQVNDIVKYLPGDVWRLFYNGIILSLILIVLIVPFVLIGTISIGLVIFLVVLLFIGLLLAGPQLSYALTAANYLVVKERLLITAGFRKAWGMMSGNFWWTWVTIVVGSIIVGVASVVFTLPISLAAAASMLSRIGSGEGGDISILMIVLGIIATAGPQLLTPITFMFSILAYHSYEEEKEGTGLKTKIDEIKTDQ